MNSTNIDHTRRHVCKVFISWLTPMNRNPVQMGQQATRQKIVFVGSARMSHDELDCHEIKSVGFVSGM